jgi:hypothetical protein
VLAGVLDADADTRPGPGELRAGLLRVASRPEPARVPDVTPVTAPDARREHTQVLTAVGPPAAASRARRRQSPAVRRRRLGLALVLSAGVVAGVLGWQLGGGGSPAAAHLTSYHDADGWSIGVPDGWPAYVYGDRSWKKPGSAIVYVQVEQNTTRDAKTSLQTTLAAQRTQVPAFAVLSRPSGSSTSASADWAERAADGSTLHVRDVHVVQGGHMYALLFAAPTDDWDSEQSTFDAVRSSFSTP